MNGLDKMKEASLNNLLLFGEMELEQGNEDRASSYYKAALKLDCNNETALLACARLTRSPFEAKIYLHRLLECNPEHELAHAYYTMAEDYCTRLCKQANEDGVATLYDGVIGPRLGELFIREGVLNELQVKAALQYQFCLKQEGRYRRLGAILVDFGYISEEQLKMALVTY